ADPPEGVAILGQAAIAGLMDGGVLPVIKHLPGHGRAMSDSHDELPMVEAGLWAGAACPVTKHLPGQGRAMSDSHDELPMVEAALAELRASDFVPFAAH